MARKELFERQEKDLTVSVHYTIRGSIVRKVEQDAIKYNMTKSKIVDAILSDYYSDK